MRIAIIEDEKIAARDLVGMIRQVRPDMIVEKLLHSVRESLDWFRAGGKPDFLFTDIELTDGTCFDIFREFHLSLPVIFTTAYDHYALEAFRHNGLAYLLKPFDRTDVAEAIGKAERLSMDHLKTIESLGEQLSRAGSTPWPRTLLVRNRERIIPVSTEDVSVLFLEYGKVQLYTTDGRKLSTDLTLDLIEGMAMPGFLRLNRQAIVHRKAILEARQRPDRKIQVIMNGHSGEDLLVSKEKAPAFLAWLAEN
jgi:DNA-binding LytR/AlgR family response regulator